MTLVTMIRPEQRVSSRHLVALGVTLGSALEQEAAVMVEDVSCSGFRMIAGIPLSVGDPVVIHLPWCGARGAMVVRQDRVRFGCTFDVPIGEEELPQVIAAQQEVESLRRHRIVADWRPSTAVAV